MKPGSQLYINKTWFFDVKSIDDDKVKVRIKYKEGMQNIYVYKVITLPMSLFKDINETDNYIECTVNLKELKKLIGSLIDRLYKEPNIYKIIENMGAVSNPGLSGTPGTPGSSGSGDVSFSTKKGSIFPNNFGLEIVPKKNFKQLRKLLKGGTDNKNGIKKPLLNILKLEEVNVETTDNDYKNKVFTFLDYPTDNDIDIKFITVINEFRPNFLEISQQRIKQYFKDLYTTNKTLIKNKCSDWFQNNILILADITE